MGGSVCACACWLVGAVIDRIHAYLGMEVSGMIARWVGDGLTVVDVVCENKCQRTLSGLVPHILPITRSAPG